MHDLERTIKHFESLQKRYTTQHNGKMCERVADALEALNIYKKTMKKIEQIENLWKTMETWGNDNYDL